jgi:peptide/nickel transport system substrate-binding protein
MKRDKVWLVISLLVIAGILLASCAPKVVEGDYLTVNFEQVSTWVRNFNLFSPDALGSTATAIYEPMMIYNKSTGELVPWLATSFTWSADNTILRFSIRADIKWSDGQAFTANDVVYTFNLLKNNPALAGTASGVLNDYVESFSAADDHTVEFIFNTVYTPALYDLANQPIVPEHIWKDVPDPITYTNENPVGTGPFTEISKFESQIYILERNPHYWQTGKPYFKGIRYPSFADNDAANLALAKGELDWAGNFVPDAQNTYTAKNPANFHYFFVGGDSVLLYINLTIKPFDNPDVRKAISMGIDRQMIVQTAMFDYIPPADATGLGDTYSAWKDPAVVATGTWVNYDIAAANAALDAAGLTRGADGIRLDQENNPMKYTLIVPSGWTDWISAAQIISQNMAELGITITIDTPEENTDITQVEQGIFEWAILWGNSGPTPFNFYRGQMANVSILPVGDAAGENFLRYDNPEADTLLEEFAQTSDPDQQKSLMSQIEAIFIENAPAIPLFPGPDWYEYNTTRFTGFPSAEDPYAPGVPYGGSPYNTPLIVLTTITPK